MTTQPPPTNPKLYHIVHVDKLASIVASDRLYCDAVMVNQPDLGTTIGMGRIKERRLHLGLQTCPGLNVGECVPFYFCPRSVMLYLLHKGNHPDLTYRGGQSPIVHLEMDMHRVVDWAERERLRWAFTLSNAGSNYFEDRNDLADLNQINWAAISTTDWRDGAIKDGKQAEFLVERESPWNLVERIGTESQATAQRVLAAIQDVQHKPLVEIKTDWYY